MKLPPLKIPPLDVSSQKAVYEWGLQCFEAGRQQGIAEERERREQHDLHYAITAARKNWT